MQGEKEEVWVWVEVCWWLQGLRLSSVRKSSHLDALAAKGAHADTQLEVSHRIVFQVAVEATKREPTATELPMQNPQRVPVGSAHFLIEDFYGIFILFFPPFSPKNNYPNFVKNAICFEKFSPQFLAGEERDTED